MKGLFHELVRYSSSGSKLLPCLFLALSNLPIVTAQSPQPNRQFDSLTRQIQTIINQEKTPGVQVLIFSKDSLLYKLNKGVTNLKNKTPVTEQSMFRLGSISKSFVAVSALMLLEKKRLALSEELKKVAPAIMFKNAWETTNPVKIVHLLEHTTGFDDLSLKDFAVNDPALTLQKGLDTSAASRHARWRPGTFSAYCNSGPTVVARLIEQKTGQEYESFVSQHLFAPLGMKRITFKRDGAALTNLVTNYSGGHTPQQEKYLAMVDRPSGSANASALELMPFVQLLMNRGSYQGKQLLQAASIDRMETPTASLAAKAGLKEGYGLCNYTTNYKGYVFHGHDGEVNGCLSSYLYNVELNRGLIVLVNSDGAGFNKIKNTVLAVALTNKPQRLPPAFTLSSTQKESLLGYYRESHVRFGFSYWYLWLTSVFQLYEQDGKLLMKNLLGGEAFPLRPSAANQFSRLDKEGYQTSWALVRNDEEQLVLTNNDSQTMTATSPLGVWLPLVLGGLALLIAAVSVVAGLIWLLQYSWLRRHQQTLSAMAVRMPLGGYALSLMLFLGVFLSQVPAHPFSVGLVGPTSLTLFSSSLLVAIFGLWAFINFLRYQCQVPSRADRAFLGVGVGSVLLVVGYMAIWSLIGIRLWS